MTLIIAKTSQLGPGIKGEFGYAPDCADLGIVQGADNTEFNANMTAALRIAFKATEVPTVRYTVMTGSQKETVRAKLGLGAAVPA